MAEIGASAGLNLLFDHYSYRLGDQVIPGGSGAVTVSCEFRGESTLSPLRTTPRVTSRLGVDQQPVNLSDPEARAWLEAFVWPEQVGELDTLRGAMDLAGATPGVTLLTGNAATDTARLLSRLPGTEPVVVFTASLLSYLSGPQRSEFAAQLRRAGDTRRVAWVFAEAPGLLAATGLAAPALTGPLSKRNAQYLIGATICTADRLIDARFLALADPYLRWITPARHEADDFTWLSSQVS